MKKIQVKSASGSFELTKERLCEPAAPIRPGESSGLRRLP
jgi:hypothetical protein